MTATMTPVASILSTKPSKTAKPSKGGKSFSELLDFAADSIGHAIRDITDAGIPKDHPTVKELIRVADLVCALTEADTRADAPTFTVAYTPEGKTSPAPTFGNKVDDTPPANDITQRRNDFMVELASHKRMTKKEARTYIGDGAKDILAGLVGDGSILETARGRSAGYRLPEKTTTIVDPAPIVPAPVIVTTLTATVASSEDIPAGFDNGEPTPEPTAPPADDKPVKAKRTRKPKSAPKKDTTTTPTAPPADTAKPSEDAIGEAFLILGKRVSALDTVKAKRAAKLMAQLRGLLS
jgi:hypothetical protein